MKKSFLYKTYKMRVTETCEYVLKNSVGKTKLFPSGLFTESYGRVKYPGSVSKKIEGRSRHSNFGFALEHLTISYLEKFCGAQILFLGHDGTHSRKRIQEIRKDPRGNLFSWFTEKDWEKWGTQILESVSLTAKELLNLYPLEKVDRYEYGCEISSGCLSGHPDLMVFLKSGEVVIFDVKVFHVSTGRSRESRSIKTQLSLYAAIAKDNKMRVHALGILMPWQRDPKIVVYDLGKWDHKPILALAKESKESLELAPLLMIQWTYIYKTYIIGHHVEKKSLKTIFSEVSNHKRPFQVFLTGNRGGSYKNPENKSLGLLSNSYRSELESPDKPCGYVHAPYALSLSRNHVSSKDPTSPKVSDLAKLYIDCARKIGFRGVVFHIDKSPDPKEALEIIKANLHDLMKIVKVECPIFLETPCGDGNGFLSSPEELVKLISGYPPELLGICLDTCHVYVAGYEPYTEYLLSLNQAHQRVGLIHLNGAWKKKGAKADCHSSLHKHQNISIEEIKYILEYAAVNHINCIIE
jgi:deoxyribonuclease-4